MLSEPLTAILADYFHRQGHGALPSDPGSCALVTQGDLAVTVASVPDDRTAMLYASAGRLSDDAAPSEPGQEDWVVLDEEVSDPGNGAEAWQQGMMLFDQRSGAVAIAASMPLDRLDGPSFYDWVAGFLEELAELRGIVGEVLAQETEPEEDMHREAQIAEPWLKI